MPRPDVFGLVRVHAVEDDGRSGRVVLAERPERGPGGTDDLFRPVAMTTQDEHHRGAEVGGDAGVQVELEGGAGPGEVGPSTSTASQSAASAWNFDMMAATSASSSPGVPTERV